MNWDICAAYLFLGAISLLAWGYVIWLIWG